MINLYILNDNCSAAIYGIGTYIHELTHSIKDHNININVLFLSSDNSCFSIKETNGIKYWYFPKPINEQRSTSKKYQWELYCYNIIYLLQLHIKEKNKLIFHLNYNYESYFVKALKETFNCKIVTSIHYLGWSLKNNGNLFSFREHLKREEHKDELQKFIYESYLKEKSFFNELDRIICLSKFAKNHLSIDYNIPINKMDIIYNGLTDIKSNNKKQIFYKYNTPTILFVGRVDYRKGLMYALQAFKIVLKTFPDCRFIISGNGDFNSHLKECEDIWTHVTWTGKLNKDKLYNIYSIADIGILPSFVEQCSYTAIEMMMHGIPMIVSTSTGLKEMIEENYNGLHVPIKEHMNEVEIDTNLLAKKIIYLLQNPKKRKQMGINARNYYEKRYAIEIMRTKMINFYNSLYK